MEIFKSEEYIGSGRRISIFSSTCTTVQKLHCHDFVEVVYIQSGSAVQQVDGAFYEVRRGDTLFINYGATHAFEPNGDFRYINICFMPEVLSGAIITVDNAIALLSLTAFDEMRKDKNGGKISFFGEERREVEFILSCMLREFASDLPSSDKVMENYLSILFAKMLRKTLPEDSAKQNRDIWDALHAYIDENLSQELTLSALAKKSFYNPSYFSRLFKQKFGTSLSEYVRQKRMEQAMKLLRQSDLSVEEVIDATGYNDRSAFYHAFSKAAGMAPAEYRARYSKIHPQKE